MKLSIGEVARQAQVSVDTIRYYEREGILPVPERDLGGRRVYDASILDAFTLITALRSVGFGIAEVRAMTSLKTTTDDIGERLVGVLQNCDALDEALAERQQQLDAAKALVEEIRAEAQGHLDTGRYGSCPETVEEPASDDLQTPQALD